MQTTFFKQKSNYWRVFALCFFTAVLLFAPHCIVDAVESGDREAVDSLNQAIDRFMR